MARAAILFALCLAACTGATLDLKGPGDAALDAGLVDGSAGGDADGGGRADADAPDEGPAPVDGGLPPADMEVADGEPVTEDMAPPADMAAPADMAPPVDMAPPIDMALPPALDCVYRANSFGAARVELDVGPDAPDRLVFEIAGLPDPLRVDSAVLRFDSFDADHPGEEGRIRVNGQGPYDLPADLAWDNAEGTGAVDVTGDVVAGRNVIEFGPGPLARSYFGIANVQLSVRARVDACEVAPPPPPADAVVRELRYPQARYTNRPTWVVGCDNNGARAYAFTATGEEHVPSDCEGLYRAGGNRRGDAIFTFTDVVPAEYEIVVGSRHTENRNPNGALFLVNGEARRISQRSDRDLTTDVWGRRRLAGQVEVILRAEGNSDSVTVVRLVPVGG